MAQWETKTLAKAAQLRPPVAEARRKLAQDASVSFVPMEDLGIDEKFLRPKQTRPLRDVAGSYTYFADGDVLLAKITPCFENGKLGIAGGLTNGVGFGSSEYVVLRPGRDLSPDWLYYYLSREAFRFEGAGQMAGAVGHRRVAKDFIENYPIPVPPIGDQLRIVGTLDEAFAAIATARANTEQNLRNARAVFESHLDSVFSQRGEGWAEKRFGAICGFVRGPFGGSLKKAMFVDDGYAVYEQSHAISNQFTDIRYFIDERKFSEMRRFEVHPNDIVMSCAGTMGRTAIVPEGVRPGIINQALLKLTPSSEVLAAFLKSWMETEDFQDALKAYAAGAAIQNVASVKVLKDIRVPVPSLADQHRIVVLLGQASFETQHLLSIYQRKLAALDALKQSLLHQAFTGAL